MNWGFVRLVAGVYGLESGKGRGVGYGGLRYGMVGCGSVFLWRCGEGEGDGGGY